MSQALERNVEAIRRCTDVSQEKLEAMKKIMRRLNNQRGEILQLWETFLNSKRTKIEDRPKAGTYCCVLEVISRLFFKSTCSPY